MKPLTMVNGLPDCVECMAYVDATPNIAGACASVGIEHGKSTYEMFKTFIAGYHFRGHRD